MDRSFTPATGPLRGVALVPGDKSLSHRAVLFAAMAEGTSELSGVLDSADVRSSIGFVEALGATVALTPDDDDSLHGAITGWGNAGPRQPDHGIDCGNSGTTARLAMGVLAGWPITVTLTGDASLSSRPMRRVTEPLALMGARFETTEAGTLPVVVHGAFPLRPIDYRSPVASAQVKTALILAGLRAGGGLRVREPSGSRDHTERLLPAFGAVLSVNSDSHAVSLCGPQTLRGTRVAVPRDPSSAAFLAAGAVLVPGSEVVISDISLNPTRIGFLRVLERMGAALILSPSKDDTLEPMGTLTVTYSEHLSAAVVEASEVPSLVDEVPILALVATAAEGTTRFEGVGELRVKESDRLAAIVNGLTALGANAHAGDDWLEVTGPTALHGGTMHSLGDHRLAMCWAMAGLISERPVTVEGFEATDVSFPGFAELIARLRA